MTELKNKAHDVMLEEMKNNRSPAIDQIHNWLCTQEDAELLEGIIKEGKTIANSLNYAASKVKETAEGKYAVTTDEEVYEWVREYFISDEIKVSETANVVAGSTNAPSDNLSKENAKLQKEKEALEKQVEKLQKKVDKKPKKVSKPVIEDADQMNIFDFLGKED